MKILSAAQIRELDAYTIQNEPISSIDLMERAASSCVDWIIDREEQLGLKTEGTVRILCGKGNNGGDGLAIARLLSDKDIAVEVVVLDFTDRASDDFKINYDRIKTTGVPIEICSRADEVNFHKGDLIIDAVFGTGLTRRVDGWVAELFEQINRLNNLVVAIDVPSGLFDGFYTKEDHGTVLRADLTLTFQSPKLSFLLPESGLNAGDVHVLDIGLDESFIENVDSKHHLFTLSEAAKLLQNRSKFSHKGSFGHALIIGGSKGKMGAISLSTKSCLRIGAGLVTSNVPAGGLQIIQSIVPEAMAIVDDHDDIISGIPNLSSYTTVAIGPGYGTEEVSQLAFKLLIQESKVPLVIDADALNILSENLTWLGFLPANSILTPHPGEFRRMVGEWSNDQQKLSLLKDLAVKHELIVVLKGAHTAIALPDGSFYFNSTGNPGLSTAGSGDVLTGIITGLVAQGYAPSISAKLGVLLHGLSGDLAAEEVGEVSLIASDIIDYLPKAYKLLQGWSFD